MNTILKRLFAPLLDHFSLLLVLKKETTTSEAVVHITIISFTCIQVCLFVCFLLTCSNIHTHIYKLISSEKAKRLPQIIHFICPKIILCFKVVRSIQSCFQFRLVVFYIIFILIALFRYVCVAAQLHSL